MPRSHFDQLGVCLVAEAFDAYIASVIEAAGLRQVHGQRHSSFDREKPLLLLGTDLMYGADQTSGIRVLGICVDFLGIRTFHDLAQVHNRHTVTHSCHNTQVMGNKENCRIEILLQFLHQLQNLCLNRHIQRCRRFISDQQLGIAHQRHGDQRPLEHAAGKLMGILVVPLFHVGNAYFAHDFHGNFLGFFLILGNVKQRRFIDLITNGIHGGEGHHRFLEDHGDFFAPDGADLIALPFVGKPDQFHFSVLLRVKQDLSAGHTFLFVNAQDGLAGQGLAAAGFANQAQGLTLFHFQVHTPHGGQKTFR